MVTAKEMEKVEKDIEKMQKEMKKIGNLEAEMKDIKLRIEANAAETKQQLNDFFERMERRLTEVDRNAVRQGKQPAMEVQFPMLSEGPAEGSHVHDSLHTTTEATTEIAQKTPHESREPLTKRMEIPMFDGSDVRGWTFRVDQYFEMGAFTEPEKLQAVRLCFEGEALSWYRWERDRNPFLDWSQMKTRAMEAFASSQRMPAGGLLLALKQDGTADEYCKQFIELPSHDPLLSDHVLQLTFMNGLQPRTAAGVRLMEPTTLARMMALARMVENWRDEEIRWSLATDHGGRMTGEFPSGYNGRDNSLGRYPSPANRGPLLGPTNSIPRLTDPPAQQQITSGSKTFPQAPTTDQIATARDPRRFTTRRLTESDRDYRRARGICFRCDGKWERGHVCSLKELRVFVVTDDGFEQELVDDDDDAVIGAEGLARRSQC